MKTLSLSFTVFFFFISFQSCQESFQSKKKLKNSFEGLKSGLISSQVSNNHIDYSLQYIPWQKYVKKNTASVKNDGLSSKWYFVLSISKDNKEILKQLNQTSYSYILQQFSFNMKNFIVASNNGMAILPEDCFFQPTYGLSSSNQLLVIFDKRKFLEQKYLNIIAKEFGLGTGSLTFTFTIKNLIEADRIAEQLL